MNQAPDPMYDAQADEATGPPPIDYDRLTVVEGIPSHSVVVVRKGGVVVAPRPCREACWMVQRPLATGEPVSVGDCTTFLPLVPVGPATDPMHPKPLTVAELIAGLQAMPQDALVLGTGRDERDAWLVKYVGIGSFVPVEDGAQRWAELDPDDPDQVGLPVRKMVLLSSPRPVAPPYWSSQGRQGPPQ